VKYIASCSFGKDSLAMILKLLELNYPLDEIVYFDIGAEFESIYQNKQRVKEILRNRDILFT
jgi:3'-phosphoadenosine 5'-phosphosulfate sulfotransferase (PAPS reductase)/FAD synthetase